MRLREHRRDNVAGRAPPLQTALRQLRMRVIDAHGAEGRAAFVGRVRSVALLASIHNEAQAVQTLTGMTQRLAHAGQGVDMRTEIYDTLDRVQVALRG